MVIYSVLSFCGELPNRGAWIFSKHNDMSVSKVLVFHLGFLFILLMLMRSIPLIYAFMPGWLTEMGSRGSTIDILLVVAVFFVHKIERRLIYVESHGDDPSRGENG